MAFKYHINIEPAILQIIEDSLQNMTSVNYVKSTEYEGEFAIDEEAFLNNLHHGFTIITMILCYVESSLNVLLRELRFLDEEGSFADQNIENKLKAIFLKNPENLEDLKKTSQWKDLLRVVRVRKALVHCAEDSENDYGSVPPIKGWKIGGEVIGDFFTKQALEYFTRSIQEFLARVAEVFSLSVNHMQPIVAFDGQSRCISRFSTNFLE